MQLSFIYGLLSLYFINCFKLEPSKAKNTVDSSTSQKIEDIYYSLIDLEGLPEDDTETLRDDVLYENLDPKKTNIDERATIFIHSSKYPKWIKMLCAHIISPESKIKCLNKVSQTATENLHYDLMSHLLNQQVRPTPFTYFDKPYMPTKKIPTFFKKNRLPLVDNYNDYNTFPKSRDSQISLQTKYNDTKPAYGVFLDNSNNNIVNLDNKYDLDVTYEKSKNENNNYNSETMHGSNGVDKNSFNIGDLYNNNENVKTRYNPENVKNTYKSDIMDNNNDIDNNNFNTPPKDNIKDQMNPPETKGKPEMYVVKSSTETYKINLLPNSYQKKDEEHYEDYTTQLTYVENVSHINGNYMFSKLNYVNDIKENNNYPVAQDWKGITYYVKANRLEGLKQSVDCDIFKCIMKKPSVKFVKSRGDVVELQCKCMKRKVYKKGGNKNKSRYTVLVNNRKRTPEFTIQSEELDDYVNAIIEHDLIRRGVKFY